MTLSNTSFEILSDLLAMRLDAFLVTSADETRELRQLKACQSELTNLRTMARQMAMPRLPTAPAEAISEQMNGKPKISRRLQRMIHRAHEAQGRAVG